MMIQVLSAIHDITTMMFGIFLSAFLLGVRQNRRNSCVLFFFFSCVGLVCLMVIRIFGSGIAKQVYPLFVHLPLIIFLILYYKYPFMSSMISTLSAYLFCQISNWVGLAVLSITHMERCYYIARIITTVITFILLIYFVCPTTATIFAKDRRSLYIFGFLPFVYYIFDYVATKFSSLLYTGNKAVVEFMGFILCISYLVFIFIYFKEYEQKQEISQYNNLMEIQLLSVQNEIEQVRQSKKMLSILRHDMRHHLNVVLSQLYKGNTELAIDYITNIEDTFDKTVFVTFCKNEMVNSILSIYQTRFVQRKMNLICDISITEQLPCSDIAFCAILSNALENSMHALEMVEDGNRWAKLRISRKDQHILLRLENPTAKIPQFSDGAPVSEKKGHGIGVKSIIYYVEKLKGQCYFSIVDDCFLLRIII